MNIGILSLQGSFAEHAQILDKLEVQYELVRDLSTLQKITHLIIPGGESPTMLKLLKSFDMWKTLDNRAKNGEIKILGTCAGAIICERLGMNIKIDRNAYGAQQSSFSAPLESDKFPHLRGVFIRAPKFHDVGDSVDILATFEDHPVLIEEKNFLAAAFHPEIVGDTRIHEYFLKK